MSSLARHCMIRQAACAATYLAKHCGYCRCAGALIPAGYRCEAGLHVSAAVALQLYDLDKTGDIQPGEVKRLLVALLNSNPDIALDERVIAQIVDQVDRHSVCRSRLPFQHTVNCGAAALHLVLPDASFLLPLQTFEEADIAKDGRISKEEWIILCKNQPAIISFMTLPLLKNDLTKKYPSFIFNV